MSQTVFRAMQIMESLSERPHSLGEISIELDVHKSTALRLLQTLEAGGFVRRDDKGLYDIGFRVMTMSEQARNRLDIYRAGHDVLMELSNELGHTLHLAQLIGFEVPYVDKVDGKGSVKMYSRIGRTAVIHTSGVGKAILAGLEEPLRSEVLARVDYKKYTEQTITSESALLAELAVIAERGWAEDNGEFESEINCVAVPIKDGRGIVRAALSLTAVRALAPLPVLREGIPRLLQAAEMISSRHQWTS